jgi:hypothetical protein
MVAGRGSGRESATAGGANDPAGRGYSEVLYAPTSWWLLGCLFTAAVFWAFLLATPLLVTVVAGAIAAVLVGLLLSRYGSARVATDPDGFSAGRALLPYRFVGEVRALDEAEARRVLGVDANARAYLLVRAYCRGAVQVSVADPADPTPYWLVSTRRPSVLAASLERHRVQD